MYTKESGSYSTKTADSEKTKELGSKKNIKTFPPNYQLFIKAAKKLLYEGAKSIFLSTRRLATFDYLKSEDKTEHTSIRYWFRMLFLRKRAWEYRLEGLIEVVPFLMLFLLFDRKERRRVFQKIVLYIPFGDVNSVCIVQCINVGTWKKTYNSKYESVLAFLLFDPVGRLAQDFPYKDSHLSYLGEYLDPVSHDTLVNRWITSKSDPRIQWRLLGGDIRGRVQHRYVSEEVARVMNTSHKQEEEK
jgi:hypothetical protein